MHRPPRATYRLQLTEDLTFADAARMVGYLSDLGISHLHLSPILTARPRSRHFYDVADHSRIDSVLGGEQGLQALADTAHAAGMGLIADVVGHHMGVGPWSPLWDTLLREGRSSTSAAYFDIDWETPLPGAREKVILPVLPGPYGDELTAGRLRLAETPAGVRITSGDLSFPLSAETVQAVERVGTSRLEGRPGDARSWTRMHSLLEQQHYRLVSWSAGSRLVNYRRFLHINALAALRVEDEAVFDATHQVMVDLVTSGVLDGLRVDHIDGHADPTGYLQRLRDRVGPDAWLVVEKMTSTAEPLPADWPVDGTTGYELLRTSLGMQVDPLGLRHLQALARSYDGLPGPEDRWMMKSRQLDALLGPDLRRLTRAVWDACQDEPSVRDVDYRTLLDAVSRVLVSLPVHRTYVDPRQEEAAEADRAVIAAAVETASSIQARRPVPDVIWRYLTALLAGPMRRSAAAIDAVVRFQQLSAPVMSLGVEQRLFFRHQAMVGACELGCDPDHVPMTVEAVHQAVVSMPPAGMRVTATHDTLHGEDVRLRIAALAGMAAEWAALAEGVLTQRPAPDAALGLRLLQVAQAVWPIEDDGIVLLEQLLDRPALIDRFAAYAVESARRQALITSHTEVDSVAEAAVDSWARALLDPAASSAAQLRPLARRAAEVAMAASLSQTLLRITTAGVPDTYQGTERWDDSLLDPDNRRPVDVEVRAADQERWVGQTPEVASLWIDRRDGRVKHWVLRQALRARASHPDVFGPDGGYEPVAVHGRWAAHLLAFRRTGPGGQAVVLCPRVLGRVTDGGRFDPTGRIWADTEVVLPDVAEGASWRDALTGQSVEDGGASAVPASLLLADLPVALLIAGS
ncbi:malto-oligosyltrehalose synthase [soil metagenome]